MVKYYEHLLFETNYTRRKTMKVAITTDGNFKIRRSILYLLTNLESPLPRGSVIVMGGVGPDIQYMVLEMLWYHNSQDLCVLEVQLIKNTPKNKEAEVNFYKTDGVDYDGLIDWAECDDNP